jgi:hypothetical protein
VGGCHGVNRKVCQLVDMHAERMSDEKEGEVKRYVT